MHLGRSGVGRTGPDQNGIASSCLIHKRSPAGSTRPSRCIKKTGSTEARVFYTKVLTFAPDDPDANHLIGLIEQQDGHLDLALERLTKARRLDPGNAELASNLGNLFRALGRNAEAIETFKAGLALKPGLPELHNNLGVAHQDAERHDLAVPCFTKAVELKPDYAEAHANLGVSLAVLGRASEAMESLLAAIGLAPHYEKAITHLDALLEGLERNAAPKEKARVTRMVGSIYDRLGQTQCANHNPASALAAFEKSLTRVPDNRDVAERQLDCLLKIKRPQAAVDALEKLITANPENARYYALIGQSHGQLGATEASIAALRQAVALDPDNAGAYQMLARAMSLDADDELVEDMVGAYARARPDSPARMRMAFTLAKAKEDQADYQQAFAYLSEAHAIRRTQLHFDLDEARRRVERLRAVFTPDLMRARREEVSGGAAPIFIVGMPRSGTTLIESILAAHGQVQACGETDSLIRAAVRFRLRDAGQPPLFAPIGAGAQIRSMARAYLDRVRVEVPEMAAAPRFTDKMPDNFWNVGLIRLAFPEATIIHCRRDPADTCLSLFKSDFNNTGHRYAHDLTELGAYYNLYRDTMRHWDEILPAGSVKTVDYEQLVADPETETRRLVEMCGLDWDDKCRAFHKTGRAVYTASLYQVRRPIYASSVNLADRYGTALAPLRLALADTVDTASQYAVRSRPRDRGGHTVRAVSGLPVFRSACRFEIGQDRCSGVLGAYSCRVDLQLGIRPRVVLACRDRFPVGQVEAGDIGRTRLDAPPVFGLVAADQFDADKARIGVCRDVAPGVACHGKRIDRIGDDIAPERQIVGGKCIKNGIAGNGQFRDFARLPQGLLGRIDAQIESVAPRRQGAREVRLAGAGQA